MLGHLAHPNGDCQIAEGPYAGHTLSWLWAEHRELFGNCEGKEFPLLIKILDAKDDLSIQIHPNDEYAAEHENGSLGKTECWYVLDCEPDATIIVGQRAKDRAEAAQMIEEGRWDDMLNVLPIHKGDFFQIDSGTVHAIKTGTLILETQQSSDVTYRLYDYDRPGTDGNLRPLHIEQSLDCIDFDAQAPTDGTVTAPEVDGVTELESNPCYTVDRVRVNGSKTLDQRWPFMCLSVIDGEGTVCGDPVHKGSHLLAPSTVSSIDLEGKMELIISTCRPPVPKRSPTGRGVGRLLGQSCSHGEHIKCSPARAELAIDQTPRPVPASLWLVTTIKKQQGAPPLIKRESPSPYITNQGAYR